MAAGALSTYYNDKAVECQYTVVTSKPPIIMAATDVNNFSQPDSQEGWLRYRYVMTFLLFLACAVCYSHRVDLSIGIVAMTNRTSANPDFEDFDWDSTIKNTMLSSFFWGYVVLQVPAGLLAQALGAQSVLLGGVAISSIATLLTPLAAYKGGWQAMYAVRVVAGLSQGALFPSIHAVLARWVPPAERGFLASIAFSGSQFGTIITFPLGGLLASGPGGWPSIFYFLGGFGILWCVLWAILSSSYPGNNRFISENEKTIIEQSLGGTTKTTLRTPWISIFTSVPMWAIIIGHSSQNWGYWTLMTEIPSYMSTVLKFDIKSNGLLSALPYLVMALLSYLFGYLADRSVTSNWITVTWCRKIFNTIGFWGPAAALAGLGYMTADTSSLAVGLLVLGVGLNAGAYLGFQINHLDLSPNFASTMMGITNCCSNIFSIIGPLVVGYVVVDEGSTEQWRIVFWIAAGVYFFGNIVFCAMSGGTIQPWNEQELETSSTNESQPTRSDSTQQE